MNVILRHHQDHRQLLSSNGPLEGIIISLKKRSRSNWIQLSACLQRHIRMPPATVFMRTNVIEMRVPMFLVPRREGRLGGAECESNNNTARPIPDTDPTMASRGRTQFRRDHCCAPVKIFISNFVCSVSVCINATKLIQLVGASLSRL